MYTLISPRGQCVTTVDRYSLVLFQILFFSFIGATAHTLRLYLLAFSQLHLSFSSFSISRITFVPDRSWGREKNQIIEVLFFLIFFIAFALAFAFM